MTIKAKLYTEVPLEVASFRIDHSDSIFLLGSCFTENIGKRLAEFGFQTMMNPFGILYNPLSMAIAMSYCLDDKRIGEESLVFHDDLWHSWLHHGAFSRRDKQECLDVCNQAISDVHQFLQTCNTIIITFGSAWYYRLKCTHQRPADGKSACELRGENKSMDPGGPMLRTHNSQFTTHDSQFHTIVANCHKVPASNFEKRLATVEEAVNAWTPLLERLLEKGVRIIFTVSPVRHQAYGAHGNQLGKAVLLLAIDQLNSQFTSHNSQLSEYNSQLAYFPAYEIVTDELRDYRFYADDMAHPSALAEQIVWRRFQETFMNQETIDRCIDYEKMIRRNAHRPLH